MHQPVEVCPMCCQPKTPLEIQYLTWCEDCEEAWAAAKQKLQVDRLAWSLTGTPWVLG